MKAAAILAQAIPLLRVAGVDDPAGDARKLLSNAMGLKPGRLSLHLQDALSEEIKTTYLQYVRERCERKPVSQIIGGRWFYENWFFVNEHVLDPRAETEVLIEKALGGDYSNILDLGLGSGCILLTLLNKNPTATGVGSDISAEALEVAARNVQVLGLEDRASLTQSDWFSGIEGKFDLIVSNPPYIAADEMFGLAPEVREHEPALALTPGGDGLGAYRAICAEVMDYLVNGGRLIVEIGPTQAAEVSALFAQAGLREITVTTDFDGRDRVIEGKKPPKSV